MIISDRLRRIMIPVFAILISVSLWLLIPGTHLVMDEGYRLLQAASLHRNVSFPVMIDYPGRDQLEDLAEGVRPVPAHYGSWTEEGLVCFYNPAIALLSSPFSGKGALLTTMLSGILLWMVLWRKLVSSGFSLYHGALIPFMCTPLLYFSMGIWSYPAAILLVFCALESAERKKHYLAFLLAGAAALLRTEFAVSFVLVFFKLDGKWYRRILAAVPAAAVLLAGNWLLSGGDYLGRHVLAGVSEQSLYSHGDSSLIQQKLYAVSRAYFAVLPGITGFAGFIPGVLLWGLWAMAVSGRITVPATLLGLSLCLAGCVMWAAGNFAFLDGFTMKHPLMVFPVLWLFTGETLRKGWQELLLLALFTALLLPMHTDGPAWGVRHIFLPVFLLLRYLRPSSRKPEYVIAGGAILTSFALLFLGINRDRVQQLNSMVLARGNSAAVTNWIIPGWLTDTMLQGKPVVYTSTAGQLGEALLRLRDEDPVVVCLGRDAAATADILEISDQTFRVTGEVEFGESLTCVVFSGVETE